MSVSTTDAARTFFRVLESGELDDLTPLLAESLVYIVPYSRTGDLARTACSMVQNRSSAT
jgi:hypothetical protein